MTTAATRSTGVGAGPAGVAGPAVVAGVAVLLGLVVGCATSFLQTVLPSPFGGLANAVAPWLMAPFVVGLRCGSRWRAAVAGLLTCLGQVAGYYLTADLRGFPVGGSYLLVWSVAAVVGGPVLGVAGRLQRSATGRLRGLAPALVAGVWATEAVATYALVLHHYGEAVVFGVVAVALLLVLGRSRGRLRPALVWLGPVLVLGVGAFLALQAVLGGGPAAPAG